MSSPPFESAAPPPTASISSRELDGLFLALIALSSAACACFWSSDGDLGFHLATGREVLATGHIPTHNVLSYAQPEQPWWLHQWLPGVIFELLFRSYGIAGVIALKMLIVALIWVSVYQAARRAGASPFYSACSCLLGIAASAFRYECRPYLFTHLTLALISLAVGAYQRAAAQGTRTRALTWAALVAALGCQLHAGAIDGLLLLGIAAVGVGLEPLRARLVGNAPHPPCGSRPCAHLLLTAAAGLALGAALLAAYHPLGPAILAFPFHMGTDAYLGEHLVEFRRAYAFPFAMLAAFWLFLALWAGVSLRSIRVVHAVHALIALVYALLALRFVRMTFAFCIVATPSLALGLQQWQPALTRGLHRAQQRRLAALALIALAAIAPLYALRDHTPGFGYERVAWPLSHFQFVRAHALAGRAFVSDAWAGPFLGFFYPERRVFFDNRLEAYTPEFVRDVYQRIRSGDAGWDALLDRYHVDYLLLRYTTPGEGRFQRGAPNLRQRLAADPRYTLVRFDDEGELFVRTAGANAALAQRQALPGIDPDRRVLLGAHKASATALLSAIRRGERSATLFGMSALAFQQQGETQLARELLQQAKHVSPDDPWLARVEARIHGAQP